MDILLAVLLLLAFAAGLLLVPFAVPGLWLMVVALIGYGAATGFAGVGLWTILLAAVLAALGDGLDVWLSHRFAQRYGGSRRAGWGSVVGGIVGALVGVPLPVIGSLVGAFMGAFLGAAVMEYSAVRRSGASLAAGWGAVLGRAVSAAVKGALGVAIVILGVYQAFF